MGLTFGTVTPTTPPLGKPPLGKPPLGTRGSSPNRSRSPNRTRQNRNRNRDRNRSRSPHSIRKDRPSVGKVRPSVGKVRPSVGKVRPSVGKVRPSVGKVRPKPVLANEPAPRPDPSRVDQFTVVCYAGGARPVITEAAKEDIALMCQGVQEYATHALMTGDTDFVIVAHGAHGSQGVLMGLAVCYLVATSDVLETRGRRAVIVDAICAMPDQRVGRVLMSEIEAVGKALGAAVVVLQSVPYAVGAYEKWGFRRGGGPASVPSSAKWRYKAHFGGTEPPNHQLPWMQGLRGMMFDMNDPQSQLVGMWKSIGATRATRPPAPVSWDRPVRNEYGHRRGRFVRVGVGVLRFYTRAGKDWVPSEKM